MKSWTARLRASLKKIPPEQAVLLLSVGLVLGAFPIMGVPSLLCLLAAAGLRLNLAALQVINNVCSPLQLALLLPLARAGAWFCRDAAPRGLPLAARIAVSSLHAVAGWACVCVPAGVVLHFILIAAVRRWRVPWFNSLESPVR